MNNCFVHIDKTIALCGADGCYQEDCLRCNYYDGISEKNTMCRHQGITTPLELDGVINCWTTCQNIHAIENCLRKIQLNKENIVSEIKNCLNCKHEPEWDFIDRGDCRADVELPANCPICISKRQIHKLKTLPNVRDFDQVAVHGKIMTRCNAWEPKEETN